MSDAKIDIKQETTAPTHSVDGVALLNDAGQTVFRQKISEPDASGLMSEAVYLLRLIAGVAPARDPATHAAKVQIQGTVPVSGSLTTVTNVTTAATLTNQTNWGGFPAQNEQYGHGAIASALLVQRAVGPGRFRLKEGGASICPRRCRAICCRLPLPAAPRLVLAVTPIRW